MRLRQESGQILRIEMRIRIFLSRLMFFTITLAIFHNTLKCTTVFTKMEGDPTQGHISVLNLEGGLWKSHIITEAQVM
jgi:hypothetical protein